MSPAQTTAVTAKRINKQLVDAFSATSVIAYITTQEFAPGTKTFLLLAAPWIALFGNSLIAVLSIYVRGYAQILVMLPVNRPIRKAANVTLANPSATENDKVTATETISKLHSDRMAIYANMRLKLSEFFERS